MKTKSFILRAASIVVVAFMVSPSAFSQIKVDSNGCVSIAGNPGSDVSLVVRKAISPSSIWSYTTSSLIEHGNPSSRRGVGLYASGYLGNTPYSNGRSHGVIAIAGNATPGWNYAVWGRLFGSNNGAAIFGSVPGMNEIDVGGMWAGYFRGNVRVEGTLWVNSTAYTSDITLKKNVKAIEESSTKKLFMLDPIRYQLQSPDQVRKKSAEASDTAAVVETLTKEERELYDRERFGLSAQGVRELFPELVYERQDGYLGVDYIGLIPLLIKALKEQQQQIDALSRLRELPSFSSEWKAQNPADNSHTPALMQNSPNPFNSDTKIEYYLPKNVSNAILIVYNMQGMQVNSYPISSRGQGFHTILASELSPGMYLYALIADGKEVDTKKMILTK